MTKKVDLMIGPHIIGPRDYNNEVTALYDAAETKFALAEENHDGDVKNVCAFLGCRDLLANCVSDLYGRPNKVPSATRLLFYKQRCPKIPLIKRAERAAHLLRSIERDNKWKRTRVFTIYEVLENEDTEAQGCFTADTTVYIRGSKMWIKNVYFFYMYIHIIRAFISDNAGHLAGVNTFDDFKKAVVIKRDGDGTPVTGLITHIRGIDYWPLVFQRRRELFNGQTIKKLYVHEHGTDGIYQLTSGASCIAKVRRRFNEILQEETAKNG